MLGAIGFVLLAVIVGVVVFCFIHRRRRQPPFDADADNAQITQIEGLIEWDDLMAHAPYKPQLAKQLDMADWPFVRGDKIDLSTISTYDFADHYKELQFLHDVKGNEDYGFVSGKFEGKDCPDNKAIIYYSKSSDRIKAFADRLSHLYALFRNHKRCLARIPIPSYYWLSPDPAKFSYLVVDYHGMSLADAMKEARYYERIGFTYMTLAALSSIHELGCVHRDVTPAAFMVGCGQEGDKMCYISHLCLSRVQYNVLDNAPRRRRVNYFGTHKYASRAAHAQQERYFKDDVESWFFTAIELVWPTTAKELVMPWHVFSSEIGLTDHAELHKKYEASKDRFLRTFGKNQLIQTFPAPQFRILVKEILRMKFDTMKSDYSPRFFDVLQGMIEQFPAQFGEECLYDIVQYLTGLNDNGCYVKSKFKF
ncbi:CK1/WORM6 protein kinase [Aphelenchoides avenae]|nr:CK1/WORM6 protein kinase [Aphelenchus avenae]